MGESEDDAKAAREGLIPTRAKIMVDTFGADAAMEARTWSDWLRAEGDLDRAAAWQPIIQAIEELLEGGAWSG